MGKAHIPEDGFAILEAVAKGILVMAVGGKDDARVQLLQRVEQLHMGIGRFPEATGNGAGVHLKKASGLGGVGCPFICQGNVLGIIEILGGRGLLKLGDQIKMSDDIRLAHADKGAEIAVVTLRQGHTVTVEFLHASGEIVEIGVDRAAYTVDQKIVVGADDIFVIPPEYRVGGVLLAAQVDLNFFAVDLFEAVDLRNEALGIHHAVALFAIGVAMAGKAYGSKAFVDGLQHDFLRGAFSVVKSGMGVKI